MLVTAAAIFTILASAVTILVFLGPVLRMVVHFEDLYKRLVPDNAECIVDRMLSAETSIKELKKDVGTLAADVGKIQTETHAQTEELGKQTDTLGRIEQQTGTPAKM